MRPHLCALLVALSLAASSALAADAEGVAAGPLPVDAFARLEKGIGQSYRIWDGTFTTCQCEDGAPDWSISGEEIDVELGGWGTLRDGVFKIKDRAVLYLPYFAWAFAACRRMGGLSGRAGATAAAIGALPMLVQGVGVFLTGRRLMW